MKIACLTARIVKPNKLFSELGETFDERIDLRYITNWASSEDNKNERSLQRIVREQKLKALTTGKTFFCNNCIYHFHALDSLNLIFDVTLTNASVL